MGDPYRTMLRQFSDDVYAQMVCATAILAEWRDDHPVIAGGALWSWAANQLADDVDIFMEDTRHARKRCDALGVEYENPVYVDLYGEERRTFAERGSYRSSLTLGWFRGTRCVHRYRTRVSPNVWVDFVLNPWPAIEVVRHFDYVHLANAFGARTCETAGAYYYARGWLVAQADAWNMRSSTVMQKKVNRTGLWGQPEAFSRLALVMQTLSHLYHGEDIAKAVLAELKERA